MPHEDNDYVKLWYFDNTSDTVIGVDAIPSEDPPGYFYIPKLGISTCIGKLLFDNERQAIEAGLVTLDNKIAELQVNSDLLREQLDD